MTTLYTRTLFSPNPPPPLPPSPQTLPPLVYRVHHPTSQTTYSFSKGFSAKNHTTILSTTAQLQRFGLAHIRRATNISSPFISAYDSREKAEKVGVWMAKEMGGEVVVVEIDTRYLGRGPVLRAADLVEGEGEGKVGGGDGRVGDKDERVGSKEGDGRRDSAVSGTSGKGKEREEDGWLHEGEYLFMYRIPIQAVRGQMVVARGEGKGVGVIGSR